MKCLIVIGCVLAFSGVALIFVPYEDPNSPHAGDVIAAQFVTEPQWLAGEIAWIRIRLLATDRDGNTRRLDFNPSPSEAPRAQIVFRNKEGTQLTQTEFDSWKRCCGGILTNRNPVHVPNNADQTNLSISIPQVQDGFVAQRLEQFSMPVERSRQAP